MAQDANNSTTTTAKLTAEGEVSTETLKAKRKAKLKEKLKQQLQDAVGKPSLRQLAVDSDAIRKLSTVKVFRQFAVNFDWKEFVERGNQQSEENQKQSDALEKDRECIDDVISGRALAREVGRGVRDLAERGNAASIAAAAITTGDFVATDTADSAAFIAEAVVAGDLAAIERADGASFVAVETGHTTAERLRLTVTARREETKQLRDSGLSTRQIAKQTGVSQAQVRRDLSQKGSKSEPERLTKAELINCDSIQPQETGSTAELGDPFRTGLSGHPNYSHLIVEEAERRINKKEVVPAPKGLAQFARDLVDWWEVKRQTFNPHAPPVTTGRIENRVRDIWNKTIANPTK